MSRMATAVVLAASLFTIVPPRSCGVRHLRDADGGAARIPRGARDPSGAPCKA